MYIPCGWAAASVIAMNAHGAVERWASANDRPKAIGVLKRARVATCVGAIKTCRRAEAEDPVRGYYQEDSV